MYIRKCRPRAVAPYAEGSELVFKEGGKSPLTDTGLGTQTALSTV